MDIIYEIRRRNLLQKQTITAIARDMGISRPTVRKHLNTVEEPKYDRVQAASPKLGQFEEQLTQWLLEESKLARPRRRSAHRLFEGLREIGYIGAYDSVQRFVKRWKSGNTGPPLAHNSISHIENHRHKAAHQERQRGAILISTCNSASVAIITLVASCTRFAIWLLIATAIDGSRVSSTV